MTDLKPFVQGYMRIIVGPVWSGKSRRLINTLNSAKASKVWKNGNLLLVKHPEDDKNNPGKIGTHKAVVTSDPDEIAHRVGEQTEYVVIGGGNHYTTPNIVTLCKELVQSNRVVLVSGTNLDYQGRPFNFMPQLMSHADFFNVEHAICAEDGCSGKATRSTYHHKRERWEPRCMEHFRFEGRPDHKHWLLRQLGSLEMIVGSMYASKTDSLVENVARAENGGKKWVAFKWLNDSRYKERKVKPKLFDKRPIVTHDDVQVEGILVKTADHIREWLSRNPGTTEIYIDEGQFIEGIYDLVNGGVYQGYKFVVTGLLRDFRMQPFGNDDENPADAKEFGKLLTIADTIREQRAGCDSCGHPATENQRLKKNDAGIFVPADYGDPIVLVGGKEGEEIPQRYEARCRKCMVLPGQPADRYGFTRIERNI